ncbi:hypothetical protein POJ06DRAFT_236474 [Lipomyces tetrasporus]|uniref:Uncharacterized protein n=1 Tax=Lipomyces tetrasporus TaxID=54092 RepID=A0AAD7VV28_9ASCO|nr:uncharacterized protein POJ06DRAFT_236474 [Lipomyces tetrasporus]KAJ8101815.1 hypothetical protein POJ06DRAFT_236474 [Lipomyces tetrasporus]
MARHHYSPLRTAESLTHQRSCLKLFPKPSTHSDTPRLVSLNVSSASALTVSNTCMSSQDSRRFREDSSTTTSQCVMKINNVAAGTREIDVDSGVDSGVDEANGHTSVDYDSVIAVILSANKQSEMSISRNLRVDTSYGMWAGNIAGAPRRNARTHEVKRGKIIQYTRKGELIDLDEVTLRPLQPVDSVSFNTLCVMDCSSLPRTDNDLASIATQLGINDYPADLGASILEPQQYSRFDEAKSDTLWQQSFHSSRFSMDDEFNPFLQTYFDPCDINTDPVQSLSSICKIQLVQELLVRPLEDTKPSWMQLDEYATVESLTAPDGLTGVLYNDEYFQSC